MTDTLDVASPEKQQRASYKFIGSRCHIGTSQYEFCGLTIDMCLYGLGA